jgi:hypothetical protein
MAQFVIYQHICVRLPAKIIYSILVDKYAFYMQHKYWLFYSNYKDSLAVSGGPWVQ